MKTLTAILLLLVGVGCSPPQAISPIPAFKDSKYCGVAEERLEELQCEEPPWLSKGERFSEACYRAHAADQPFLNPRCVHDANGCDEVRECSRK